MITTYCPTTHHGLLLKNYIVNNKINRKGGLNKLINVLGITRQNIYVMYKQRKIKEKHRSIIIKHLQLPDNFFPIANNPTNHSDYVVELQKQFIKVQGELLDAERRINYLNYAPKLYPIVVDNDNRDQIALVPRKAVAGYAKNCMDTTFVAQLQTFSLPNFNSGFAFEIEGNSMEPSNINDKDFVICEELVENIEQLNEKNLYIIVLNNGDIVCKLIRLKDNVLTLISTNKLYQPYDIEFTNIKQIWKVKGKYTPDLNN